jgi:ribosome-associated translation inhibitor RaiA
MNNPPEIHKVTRIVSSGKILTHQNRNEIYLKLSKVLQRLKQVIQISVYLEKHGHLLDCKIKVVTKNNVFFSHAQSIFFRQALRGSRNIILADIRKWNSRKKERYSGTRIITKSA